MEQWIEQYATWRVAVIAGGHALAWLIGYWTGRAVEANEWRNAVRDEHNPYGKIGL